MDVNGSNKGGLNELLTAMLHNENKDITYHELKKLLHRIEDDATEMYQTKYGSDDTKIRFSINFNGKESDFALRGPLATRDRKRILQAEYLEHDRQVLSTGRSTSRRGVHHLLHGDQHRRVPRSADLRDARGEGRLEMGIHFRRIRDDPRSAHFPLDVGAGAS